MFVRIGKFNYENNGFINNFHRNEEKTKVL